MGDEVLTQGLPPPLLRDPNLDYMVSSATWTGEVRDGIMETDPTAARHVGLFNTALSAGRPAESRLSSPGKRKGIHQRSMTARSVTMGSANTGGVTSAVG